MSSVDDRIVNMQFNNKQFTQGVTQSQKSLDGLEQSLQKTAKSQGLASLDQQVGGLRGKFSAMQVAGVAAVATIASKATAVGINLVKSLTLDPVMDGFKEYQTNLDSIQTIIANTGKPVQKVQNALNQLNHYADQTIYNFSEMAHNIGTFTAAGVDLKTSVASIKGIANLAALSGSNSQQASMAMYQLSQAIASGSVHLQDWNSVVNAGMGGKVFQTALARTGTAMGTLNKNAIQMIGPMKKLSIEGHSFRESIQSKPGTKAWLSSDVLTETLKQISGGYTKAQLASKGYTKAQIKDIESLANRAFDAATQIKSLPQLFGVIKESIGSMWSGAFSAVMGNFEQSKNLWGEVGKKLVGPFGVVTQMSNGFNNLLLSWSNLGGRTRAIGAFTNIFGSLAKILGTIKGAFRDVFPPTSAAGLVTMTEAFQRFTSYLVPSEKTLASLRSIFGGVFAVLHIGVSVVKAIAAGFGAFFGQIFKGSSEAGGGILAFAGHIGELLMKLDKFLTSGGKMTDIFKTIGTAGGKLAGQGIQIATNVIQGLIQGLGGGALGALKGAVEKLAQFIPDRIKAILGIHSPAQTMIPIGQNIILGIVQGIDQAIQWIFKSIGSIYSAIWGGLRQAFGGMNALDFASLLNAIFTAGFLLMLTKMGNAVRRVVDYGKLIENAFGQLQNTLKTFQNGIRAKALKDIAIAVGILTASLVALSFIDPKKMATGLGGIGAMLAMLVGSLATLSKVSKGQVGMFQLAASIALISGAMIALSTAVVILGSQDLQSLGKGLGALAVAMGIMVGAVAAMGKVGGVIKGAGVNMVLMAVAMNLLAGAVLAFGNMDLGTLAKGLGAIAVAMAIFVPSLMLLGLVGKGTLAAGAAIVMVAGAMVILAGAVLAFGKMDLKTLAKGFGAVAVALVLFTASLAIVGAMGPEGLAAAASILALAAAMVMLVPVIVTLGGMDMMSLVKGLGALGVALTLFVVAIAALGAVATVVGPGLLMLGGALALIGIGMAAFGAGFALMAATGTAGIAVMTAAITAFIMLLPSIAIQLAAAFVSFLEAIAAAAPRVRAAMSVIIAQLLGVITDALPQIGALISKLVTVILQIITKAIPQIGQVFSALIAMAINVVKRAVPRFVEAGYTIIDKFITSVAKHVPHIVDEAGKLIVGFLNAIGNNAGKIADAGFKMIIKFINGVANAIDNNAPKLRQAGLHLAGSIIDGMTGGLLSEGLAKVKAAAEHIADALPGWMKKVLHINSPSKVMMPVGSSVGEGVAKGIDDSGRVVESSARSLGHKVVKGVATGIAQNLKDAVSAAVRMANAVVAAGDPGVLAAAGTASDAQKRADYLQAQADLAAADVKKVNKKKNPKLAKKLQKAADRAQAAADAAQGQADAAAQSVTDLKDFNSSDLHTKGDKMNEQAQSLAAQAQKTMEKANAEAAKAVALGKKHAKEAQKMRQQAQADALEAARLANAAQAANAQANAYYGQEVMARIDAITAAREAEKKAAEEQAAYDAADTQGKIDILNKKMAELQAIADKKNADAAALLDKARAEANTNAAQAMADLDASEQAAQDAKDAADAAQQTKDQLAQLMSGDGGTVSGGGGGSTGGTVQPSRSVIEDAAQAMDRYTASLLAAQDAMNAQQPVLQFNQNNYSPEALSASEIYRQTHNLLSTQEVKMGVNSNT